MRDNFSSKIGQTITLAVLLAGFSLGIVWAMIAVGGQSLYVGKTVYAADKGNAEKDQEKTTEILMELRLNMKMLVKDNGKKWQIWKEAK